MKRLPEVVMMGAGFSMEDNVTKYIAYNGCTSSNSVTLTVLMCSRVELVNTRCQILHPLVGKQ